MYIHDVVVAGASLSSGARDGMAPAKPTTTTTTTPTATVAAGAGAEAGAGAADGAAAAPGREEGCTLGYAVPRLLLAAALQAGCMYVSSRVLQLSGTALLWPCTPAAALMLALHPSWIRRWLAAAMLLAYVAMVLLDCGKVRGSLALNVLFLLTDTAEVASVTLGLLALVSDAPPALIRTGAALDTIMLFPLVLAPLKEGVNCLLIFLCFGMLRLPVWETVVIWLVGDFFCDFFAVYATMVVRYYWRPGRPDKPAASAADGAVEPGPEACGVEDAEAGRAAAAAAAGGAPAPRADGGATDAGACARCWGWLRVAPVAREIGDTVLFVVLLALAALTSVAAIVSNSPAVNRVLLYLSSRLLFPTVGYATVRYGQVGGVVHVGVVALSMLVTDFNMDEEDRNFGLASVSAAGALLEVLVGPLRVVIMAWCVRTYVDARVCPSTTNRSGGSETHHHHHHRHDHTTQPQPSPTTQVHLLPRRGARRAAGHLAAARADERAASGAGPRAPRRQAGGRGGALV